MNRSVTLTRRVTTSLTIAASLLFAFIPHGAEASSQPSTATPPNRVEMSQPNRSVVEENYGKLPLSFEPNEGQASRKVAFLSRGANYSLFLSATQAELALHQKDRAERLQMKLVGANRNARLHGESRLDGRSNYLVGTKDNWHTNIPNYAQVRATNVYKGIDAIYYGTDQQRLEFDFVISPGSNPSLVKLKLAGAQGVTLAANGDLKIKMAQSEITQPAPVVYQEVAGQRRNVHGSYVLAADGEVSFKIGDYDTNSTLVIDPQILYASFHGGNGDDRVEDIAVDNNGNAFIVGSTLSTNLNVTGGVQGASGGGMDAFVVKINPAGTQRLFSTYLGGSGTDFANGVAVTSDGKACVAGGSDADAQDPLTTTSNRYQGPTGFFRSHGLDVFVTKLNVGGNGFEYSTFLGGRNSDSAEGIAVDGANKIYITGNALSNNFPVKEEFQEPDQHEPAAFVAKFDPLENGNDSLVYSSVIRGETDRTDGGAIAVTSNGVAFICGITRAPDFLTKSSSSLPAFQTSFKGADDNFIAKISPSGSLIYSTYFGGNGIDNPTAIAVDSNERAYLVGFTTSSAATFPLKNAFDSTLGGSQDGFIAKFNADGTALFYSTYIGGAGNDAVGGVALDPAQNTYISGFTNNNNGFPIVNGFPANIPNGGVFVAKIEHSDATGSSTPSLLYADTFAAGAPGGLAIDRKGNLYIGGTLSSNVQTSLTAGGFQSSYGGGTNDGFVAKISATLPDTIGVYRPSTKQFLLRNSNTPGAPDITKTFGVAGDIPITGDWNGDGVTDIGVFRPSTHQFLLRIPAFLSINTVIINFGLTGDQPVVGDWNNDGIDTPGVFRPSTGEWFLTDGPNVDSSPVVNDSFSFGLAGDLAIAGDFDGDGEYGVGVFRPATGEFFLDEQKLNGIASAVFNFGQNGDLPVAGDWRGDGADGVGVFRPSTGQFFLNDTNVTNATSLVVSFGQAGDQPVSGVWDTTP
jgi:hypothetical protein